jgi:hypothetical protein
MANSKEQPKECTPPPPPPEDERWSVEIREGEKPK